MRQSRNGDRKGISSSLSAGLSTSRMEIGQSRRRIGVTVPSKARHIRAFQACGLATSLRQRSLGGTSAFCQISTIVTGIRRALQLDPNPFRPVEKDLADIRVGKRLGPEGEAGSAELGGLLVEIVAGEGDVVDPADLPGGFARRQVDDRHVAEIEPITVEGEGWARADGEADH